MAIKPDSVLQNKMIIKWLDWLIRKKGTQI